MSPEEQKLWAAYAKSPTVKNRNAIAERYYGVCYAIAAKLCGSKGGRDYEECIQEGALGLMDAIRKFNPSKGVKFGTFCRFRVRGAMQDHLRTQDWVPRLERIKEAKLRKLLAGVSAGSACPHEFPPRKLLGVPDTPEGNSKWFDMEILLEQPKIMSALSVSNRKEIEGGEHEFPLADKPIEARQEVQVEVRELWEKALKRFSARDRVILRLRYQYGFLQEDIGEFVGLTGSRVCQIIKDSSETLQRAMRNLLSGEFL